MSVDKEAVKAIATANRGFFAADGPAHTNAAKAVLEELKRAGLLIDQEPHHYVVTGIGDGKAGELQHPRECLRDPESCEIAVRLVDTDPKAVPKAVGKYVVGWDDKVFYDLAFVKATSRRSKPKQTEPEVKG